jgi:peroxiredoxin family protein
MAEIPEGFIIPDFGEARSAPADDSSPGGTATMVRTGPRKIAFICSKGNLDMAYPAFIMGIAALGEGVEVEIFFTFWGMDIINTKTNHDLKFTVAGNTAMHMSELGQIKPGWEHRSIPQVLGNLPGMTGYATRMMKRQMAEQDVPTVPEFLDLMVAAGAKMYACKLSFDMMKIIEADLHPGVLGVISATDFIEIADGAQTIFI